MLGISEIDTIDRVVGEVSSKLRQKNNFLAARNSAKKAEYDHDMAKQDRLESQLDDVLSQTSLGFVKVSALVGNPKISELLTTLNQDRRSFRLFTASDQDIEVYIEMNPKSIVLGIYRYEDQYANLRRHFRYDRKKPLNNWFWHVFQDSYGGPWENDFFDWVITLRPDGRRSHIVSGRELEQFHRIKSTQVVKEIEAFAAKAAREEEEICQNAKESGEEYWSEPLETKFHHMPISPGHILVKFFYDCADDAILTEHLSRAIANTS